MLYDGFIGPSYISQALTADQEDLINFYVERMESPGATTEAALYPTPGVDLLDTAGIGPGRAHFYMAGREFAVSGTGFYEIDVNGAPTLHGTVAIDSNPATISSNGDGGGQLFITSGTNGYNFDLGTDTLTQIAALNGLATMGDQLDGYFIALDSATSTFYISNLLDGTTWTTGLDFAQRSARPDPWLAMKVSGRYIYLFGEQTSEIWYNNAASFPFALHPSGVLEYGIASQFSAARLGKDLLWVSGSREGRASVLRTSGFTPEVISTYALQNQISDYSTIEDAVGDSYSDRGHNFYLLTFPTEGVTWAWDSETQLWAKRGTWIAEDGEYTSWRPRWHAFAHNQHRMLDSENGSIYEMSNSHGLDVEDRPIRRVRRAPALMAENERVFYSKFELDLQPGIGNADAPDPQVMMRFSDDGGRTWSSEQWRSAGAEGAYSTRLEWHRLGTGRRRVFEVAMSDQANYRLTNAYLTLAQPPPGQGQRQG
jgi:hypothetical protein